MLDWIKKKNGAADAPVAEPDGSAAAGPADSAAPPVGDWQQKLQAASGDDTALLALAREDAPVDVKVAAVAALTGEAALKLAEREFRDHDRRVHRLAKQRHLALVAQRETGEQAARLIESARELVKETLIPANRLVDLDRGWQALDGTLIGAAERTEFAALQAQLAALTRERADQALKVERWTADARRTLAELQAACAAAAAGTQDRSQLAAADATARGVLGSAPEGAGATLRELLRSALHSAGEVDTRLAALEAAAQAPDEAASRWQQLAPLVDPELDAMLARRFEQWQQARGEAEQARRAQQREQARERERGARHQRGETLADVLAQAEEALAAGRLSDTNKHLVAIDELLHAGAAATELRPRIDTLQAEYARLKGWQHWGGGLARDELVLQAEALAAATRGEAGGRVVKLSTKQQAEVIDDLRARWKELDRLGGATSRALWQRFDSALKAAYQPVAAHLDAQRAARQQNLQARDQLVEALNALVLPDAEAGAAAPEWKPLAAALEHFQTEWRKLGPIEHTVPHKARDKLVERMRAAVARVEAPLNDARRGARLARERLVERAKALATEAGSGMPGRDLVARVRELQAEWQQRARELPLARSDENAIWHSFKSDIDAAFSARDAAVSARESQFKEHGAERVALIERLAALNADTPPAELRRTLAEVDAQWQRAGPAPRADAAALDARFRRARDAVRDLLAGSAQRGWQLSCDALLAKLALCEALEEAADAAQARADLASRWAELPVLLPAWEQALAERASLSDPVAATGVRPTLSTDELLLQLEAAFEVESPPVFEEARRALKLQAMKAALERRPSKAAEPLGRDQLLLAALSRGGLDAAQRERLRGVLAVLRRRGP